MLSSRPHGLVDCRGQPNNACAPLPWDEVNFVLLPYAGGSVDSFRSLRRHLGTARVTPMSYPRAGVSSVAALAEYLSTNLMRMPTPVVLFGHSFGALVAFELASHLAPSGRVRHLFLSGCAAPTSSAFNDLRTCRNAHELFDRLRGNDGIPFDMRQNDQVPMHLQHDLGSLLAYHPSFKQVSCPITCLAGADDGIAPAAAMEGWHRLSRESGRTHVMAGGHFFFIGRSREIAALMLDALRPAEKTS